MSTVPDPQFRRSTGAPEQPGVLATAGSVAEAPDPRRWRALGVLALVQFMLVLDNTVVNVALPSVQRDLAFSAAGLAWVVNAYVITAGGLLLLGGRIADLVGRRRTYLSGTALFAVASLTCGAARSPAALVTSRFLQGVGAALVAPAALSLVALLFAVPGERARAFSIWGGLAALGGTTGVVLSGVLSDLASWRWIFFVNLPVAAFALVALPRLVEESRSPLRRRLDVPGAVLATGGLITLIYALLKAGSEGWAQPGTLLPLAAALAALAAFAAVEARRHDPLLPLAFLRHRARLTGYMCGLAVMAAFFATFFSLTLYMQHDLGYSPLAAGFAYVPYGVSLAAGIAVSGAVARRRGPRTVLPIGILIAAAGMLLLTRLPVRGSYAAHLLPGLIVLGLGNGLAIPALTIVALTGVTVRDAGLGGGVQNAVLQVGGAVGLAALVGLGTSHSRHLASVGTQASAAATEGFTFSFSVAAALLVAAAVVATLGLRAPASSSSPAPAPAT